MAWVRNILFGISVCDVTYTGPDGGEFATLNYPKAYAENITCTYRINAPDGSIVHANFTDFSIAQAKSSTESDRDEYISTVTNETSLVTPENESLTYVDVR